MGENQDGSLNHNSSFSLPSTKLMAVHCAGDALGVYRDGDFVMAGNARAVASFAEVPAWLPGSSGESPYDPVRFGRR